MPFKKREAARIDIENYKFAQRIMAKEPKVERTDVMRESHNKKMKTL